MAIIPTAINGRIPDGLLSTVPGYNTDGSPHLLSITAADAFYRVQAAMRKDIGLTLNPTPGWSCYRSLANQAYMRSLGLTTIPVGQSIHGEALAVDFKDTPFGSVRHDWLSTYGSKFGFYQPAWAKKTGSLPEPWHWEYDYQLDVNKSDSIPVTPKPVPVPDEPPVEEEKDEEMFKLYRVNEDGNVFLGGPGKWLKVIDPAALAVFRDIYGMEIGLPATTAQSVKDSLTGKGEFSVIAG